MFGMQQSGECENIIVDGLMIVFIFLTIVVLILFNEQCKTGSSASGVQITIANERTWISIDWIDGHSKDFCRSPFC